MDTEDNNAEDEGGGKCKPEYDIKDIMNDHRMILDFHRMISNDFRMVLEDQSLQLQLGLNLIEKQI